MTLERVCFAADRCLHVELGTDHTGPRDKRINQRLDNIHSNNVSLLVLDFQLFIVFGLKREKDNK